MKKKRISERRDCAPAAAGDLQPRLLTATYGMHLLGEACRENQTDVPVSYGSSLMTEPWL